MRRTRARFAVALAVGGAAVVAAVAWATPAQISHSYTMAVTAEFETFPKVCDNRTSEIDLSGTLTFPGVGIELRFQNQDNNTTKGNGWHKSDVATTAALSIYDIDPGALPKQPVHGGVGGNPWIWVQLLEEQSGDPIGDPILVGRCVVGRSFQSGKYTGYVDADAAAILSTLGCDQKGAYVDVGTEAGHDGVDATVYFTNNRKWTHSADAAASVALNLTDAIHAKKGGQLNGGKVTGNPLVSARFIDHTGAPLQDFIPLGRCNTLG